MCRTTWARPIPEGVQRTERLIARGGKGEKPCVIGHDPKRDYKYVAYCGEAREEEIYNLADDPKSGSNLADASIARWSKRCGTKRRRNFAPPSPASTVDHFIDFFPAAQAVTSGSMKFGSSFYTAGLRRYADGVEELYDIRSDPRSGTTRQNSRSPIQARGTAPAVRRDAARDRS